jgi:putative heme-binding domain-containing protein
LIGERGYALPDSMKWLYELSKDEDITVRSAVAVAARQFVSGSLTVNTKPNIPLKEVVTGGVLSGLWFSTQGEADPTFTFLYWMALEPLIAYDPLHALGFYEENGAMRGGSKDKPLMPFSGVILTKIMRRICDMNDQKILSDALLTFRNLKEEHAPAIAAALKGVLEGQRGRPMIPEGDAVQLVSKWTKLEHKEASSLAQQLGTVWGDAASLTASLKTILDGGRSADERVQTIQSVRQQKVPAVRETFEKVLASGAPEPVVNAAISGLGEFGADETADLLLKQWKQFSPGTRRAVADVLSSRSKWAQRLIGSVENKSVALAEIPAPVVRNLLTSKDEYVRNRATTVIGKFRESTPDKAKLIAEKKRMVLSGPVDFKKGHEVAQRTCFTCHKLHGEGADVGPDLTGVGRSSLDALLANVIDPNQLIGAGYENVEVTLKDDRTVAGRMIENTDARVRLLVLGGKEETIAKSQIENLRVSELSVMPEGLEQMPDEDFRNLIWYILNPPQDDKAIFLTPGDKKLVVNAKIGGSVSELIAYVTDPALRPYLHPVKHPAGRTTLTQDRPDDHPWQHGIFTGLHKVNGIDFWSEKQGKLQFKRLLDVIQEQDHVGWRALVEWIGPDGKPVLEEEQFIKAYAPTKPSSYNIDFDWTLRALDQPVKIGKHEYGGFAVRMDFNGSPHHLNANGERDQATAGKRAAWCNVSRQFGDKTFGIAVFDHPGNAGFPAMWRVDAQGLINPSPSLQGDWSIEPKRERTFHYRLLVHEGPGDAQKLDVEFKSFSAITFNQMAAMHPDKESVALWNPEWKLNVPDFEDSPVKLPEFAGKRNVLLTHPFSKEKASVLEREIDVPAGKKTSLTFNVASHESGDWELRIFANEQLIKKQIVDKKGDRWKTVSVDLTPFAGKKINLRLENAANDWNYEYAYWSDIRLSSL